MRKQVSKDKLPKAREIKKERTELSEEDLEKVAGGVRDGTMGGTVKAGWDLTSNKVYA